MAAGLVAVALAGCADTYRPIVDTETVDRVLVEVRNGAGEPVFSGPIASRGDGDRAGGHVTFEAPAGTLDIDVLVQNAEGRRLDADGTSVDVPDYTAAEPLLGTPFVFAGRTARDLQGIRAEPSPTPLVRREFSRRERLLVRFSAYGPGAAAPEVGLRLLNSGGDSIAEMPPPTRSGTTFESEFGLSAFPPGDFLLEISATLDGQTTRRLVGLRVTG